MVTKHLKRTLFVSLLLASGVASATDGYFQPGYSVQSVGMGGVGIALPLDALAAASNPAGMALIGNRLDFGVSVFRPQRSASLTTPMGVASFSGNQTSQFYIPEFGFNRMVTSRLALGVSVYGNGGMNTGYSNLNSATRGAQCANPQVLQQFGGNLSACLGSPVGQLGAFGVGSVGVDLQQLFIAPTIAYRIDDHNAIGLSIDYVHQNFGINGVQAFQGLSSNPPNVTNNLHAQSDGVGFRIGWTGQLTPDLTVGATYQPKITMSRFRRYNGLFAGGGRFDIPANYGLGVAWNAAPGLTVAGDVERIEYGSVPAIANPMINSLICATPATCGLGTPDGTGFGWRSVTVVKLGVAYAVNPGLTLRAGWNRSGQPIPGADAFINVLAPGVVEDHLTLGATYALSRTIDLSFDYVHAFSHTVTGSGASQGTAIHMYEDTLGFSLGWRY